MSETAELPQGPEPHPQPMRLEDRPEFQALAPEQQEKLLALRERLMAEAANPENVVSRSINEMGFWEGLKHTVKPHMAKHKEIMFKDLKAGASAAISLVPALGEGKGLGTGLFGLTVKKGELVEKAIKFEPFVRLGNAAAKGKEAFSAAKAAPKAVDQLYKFGSKVDGNIFVRAAVKTGDALSVAGAHAKDAFRPAAIVFGSKAAAEHSLRVAHHAASVEGAKNLAEGLGVGDIYRVKKSGEKIAAKVFGNTLTEGLKKAGLEKKIPWYRLDNRWKAFGVKREAKRAAKGVMNRADRIISNKISVDTHGKNFVAKGIETGLKKASPKLIEGTRFGQYKAFFERWLNLTPDVPVWISTTTGVAEFLGAHGIDAIPAVMQMGINRYQQLKVSKDMGLDVLGYVATRALGKLAERKRAAEVFRQPVGAAATV